MTAPADHKKRRLISVVAATVIALACGTNYVYSAWAPQFAHKLKLSATEANLIGTMGNFGMYATGIPSGVLIDARGPRWGVAIGTVLFAAGYYPIAKAFDAGPGAYSVASISLFSFFTGAGSCIAFSASIKAAALNFPDHRGTATAFPLAAFGLSAFFFATLALALPHDTSHFLMLLATGTVVMPAVSFFFLDTMHAPGLFDALPQHVSQRLHRTHSIDRPAVQHRHDANTTAKQPATTTLDRPSTPSTAQPNSFEDDPFSSSEQASLLSSPSTTGPGTPYPEPNKVSDESADAPPPNLDIRGMALLPLPSFWILFSLLALMCGIGLMTINNIGNITQSLWLATDPKTEPSFIARRQVLHVSILSVLSFSGRLLSGIGSDILVRKYTLSRYWCLFASSLVFITAQSCAVAITNPLFLVFLSGFTGLAYGMLFGVYPSLVAHTFGVHGLSQNWGCMTMAPVISGNIFNLIYGTIYDRHSAVDPKTGDRECLGGTACYGEAFWMTLGASLVACGLCLFSIWHDRMSNSMARRAMLRRKSHDSNANLRVRVKRWWGLT